MSLSLQDAARVREIVSAATRFDGPAPISEQAVLNLQSGNVEHRVVHAAGRIAGYAQTRPATEDHPAMAEVVVDPAARGRGFGTELVASALGAGGPGAQVWAHGNLAGAQAVAGKLDLVVARELLQMRRPLGTDDLPAFEIPPGTQLRTYEPGDDAELLRVNAAAFDWHPEQGSWTDADLTARLAETWFDPAGLFILAAPDGRILGFHWTKIHTETPEPIGEVYVVAIDPAAQGGGYGRVLTLAGLAYLQAKGLSSVLLYTEADNERAVRLYEKLGFHPFHIDVAYRQ